MKLIEGNIDVDYVVASVELDLALERRLEALGLLPGTTLRILNKKSHGALIIFVRGTRFAIGAGIARNIVVKGAEG